MRRVPTRTLAVTAAALSLIAVGGIAGATIPAGDGTINGCYTTQTGALRVIDSPAQTCKPSETAIHWGQTGPQGTAGANGQDGDDGQDGITGFQIVGWLPGEAHIQTMQGDVPYIDHHTDCPEGKHALSGSGNGVLLDGVTHLDSFGTAPSSDGTGYDFRFRKLNGDAFHNGEMVRTNGIVTCANVTTY